MKDIFYCRIDLKVLRTLLTELITEDYTIDTVCPIALNYSPEYIVAAHKWFKDEKSFKPIKPSVYDRGIQELIDNQLNRLNRTS